MDNLLTYLLKVSAGIMLLYLCYILFFSRDTFYLRNRIFLTGFLLLSFIIPLLKVLNIFTAGTTTEYTRPANSFIISGTTLGATVSEKIASFNVSSIFIWLYFSISILLLLRLIYSVTRTLTIIRRGNILNAEFPRVVLSDLDHPPFSFYPYIVIPKKTFESNNYPEILAHENEHVRQGHTFDLLLAEFLISILWFNPFIWLIKRSIILNHEYLADNFSIKSSHSIREYQYKLLNTSEGLMNVPLAHNFSSLIKNRIVMINKRPTKNYAALKSIIILPVVAILLVMFSFKPESNPVNSDYQKPLFTKTSESEILKFLAMNTGYPQEARNISDTGKVFVVVKMNKGGIIKECKAFTEKKGINVPVLPEIVIVGYKPSAGSVSAPAGKPSGNEHPALKTECLRISNKINEINIPDWKDKDMEFAIAFKFILK